VNKVYRKVENTMAELYMAGLTGQWELFTKQAHARCHAEPGSPFSPSSDLKATSSLRRRQME
jgi:hypothetical protein